MSLFDTAFFLSTFTTLVVIADPVGNLPIFIGLTSRYTAKERSRVAWQATLTSVVVLAFFAVGGGTLLGLLDLSTASMQISGGLLLLIVAFQLMLGIGEDDDAEAAEKKPKTNPAIVPLAVPLMAGPGSIVAIMLAIGHAKQSVGQMTAFIAAFIVLHLVEWIVFRFANPIHRVIRDGGTVFLTRLAGMILAAIAVQMVINGVFAVIHSA